MVCESASNSAFFVARRPCRAQASRVKLEALLEAVFKLVVAPVVASVVVWCIKRRYGEARGRAASIKQFVSSKESVAVRPPSAAKKRCPRRGRRKSKPRKATRKNK